MPIGVLKKRAVQLFELPPELALAREAEDIDVLHDAQPSIKQIQVKRDAAENHIGFDHEVPARCEAIRFVELLAFAHREARTIHRVFVTDAVLTYGQ